MQFSDDVKWADQELELQVDDTSRKFLHFFQEWFTAAEGHLDGAVDAPPSAIRDKLIVKAMRKGLEDTESAYGFLAMEWIGQMLLLAYQHWKYGSAMERGLTVIERRALEVMAAVKAAELQASAAESATL